LNFHPRGAGKITSYAGVAAYMQAHGVDGRLLFGLKTRWAAIALFGFCLLTALFFHTASDQVIELQKNVAMAGGFLTLAICGLGRWTPGAVAPARVARPQHRPWSTRSGRRLYPKPGRSHETATRQAQPDADD
jgi:putative oxidoreductase